MSGGARGTGHAPSWTRPSWIAAKLDRAELDTGASGGCGATWPRGVPVNARRPGWFVLVAGYLPAAARLRLTAGLCQSTKSLRSSPLRGGKSREAGSQLRGQPIAGGEPRPENRGVVNLTQDGAPHERD